MPDYRYEEGCFKTNDQTSLFFRLYHQHDTQNIVFILHGHGEHSGRYQTLIDQLKASHVSVAICDHRGHGKSEGREVFVDYFDQFTEDFNVFVEHISSKVAVPQKIYLLGHSLGGLIATRWSLNNQSRVQALFLSSPCFGLNLPSWLIGFNNVINLLCPKFVYGNPIYPPHLTHDVAEMETYKKDPLIRRKITARLLNQMFYAMEELQKQKSLNVSFSVFVLMAGLEKVVDKQAVHQFYTILNSPHKEIKEFGGYYHEIFQEKGKQAVFEVFKKNLKTALNL